MNTLQFKDVAIRVTGFRTCMVKPSVKEKLLNAYKSILIGQCAVQSINLQNSKIDLDFFKTRTQLLETLKTKRNQNDIVHKNISLPEQIYALEIESIDNKTIQRTKYHLQTTTPYHTNSTLEKKLGYKDTIHEKVDTILKGTENDPIGRAQFDNFINRISQTYADTLKTSYVKEK